MRLSPSSLRTLCYWVAPADAVSSRDREGSCDAASVTLRLVLEPEGDAWRLVAVIHEGWTI